MRSSAQRATAPAASTRGDNVRRDRDRFLAFAFCAADFLIELDTDRRISFVAGASQALTGRAEDALIGLPLVELVAPPDQNVVEDLLRGLNPGMRTAPTRIRLSGPGGRQIPLMLYGYQLAEVGSSYYLALRMETAAANGEGSKVALHRDQQTGLLDKESFAELAKARIQSAGEQGDKLSFTLVRLGDLAAMQKQMTREERDSLYSTVGATLNVEAADGDCAARFDESNYGLVHSPRLDGDALKTRLDDYLKSLDPSGKGVAIEIATVADAATVMGSADSTRALVYTLGQICETALDGSSEQATTRISDVVKDAMERMTAFRRIVAKDEVQLAFQPIIELGTRKIRHFEILARFSKSIGVSPYETISFAENVGLISDFDYNMCRRALLWLEERQRTAPDKHYMVAVNLSGRSVGNAAFLDSLIELFHKHESVRKLLALEITESARIRDLGPASAFIQTLRKAGHEVCLDDFGTGASALTYLHSLEVDVVKIAGEYVRGAIGNSRYRTMLKGMGSLCAELGVLSVAEMVEDATYLPILKECGIPLAQGYYFGRPSFELNDFETVRWR